MSIEVNPKAIVATPDARLIEAAPELRAALADLLAEAENVLGMLNHDLQRDGWNPVKEGPAFARARELIEAHP